MKTAGLMLVYMVKLFMWLPVIFGALFVLKLVSMFGHGAWDVLHYMFRIAKFMVGMFT